MLVQEKQRVFSCKLNFAYGFHDLGETGQQHEQGAQHPHSNWTTGFSQLFLTAVLSGSSRHNIKMQLSEWNSSLLLVWFHAVLQPRTPSGVAVLHAHQTVFIDWCVCLYIYIYMHITLYIYIRRDSLRLYPIAYHVYSGSLIEALGIDLVSLTSSAEIKDSI